MNYENLKRIFFKFEPETAHKIAELSLVYTNLIFPGAFSFLANKFVVDDIRLKQNIFNKTYHNPIGIGGGFDKNATMLAGLTALGFGYLEYGTFTPKPQSGNEKPRLFRLVDEESIQNAMGFNNEGKDKIKKRVAKSYPFVLPLWANIGKNKTTPNQDAIKDYEILVDEFSELCDAFVINLSSPNTPNLRDLQEVGFINELFLTLKNKTQKPIILKISPDLDPNNALQICKSAVNSGADGIIISNTSIDYTLSKSPNLKDFGGLSGQVIKQKSREIFKVISDELYGQTILIACGGIDNAKEAYERIKMGASLVQIFTSFIYKGYGICADINKEIINLLDQDGFASISDAVGANHKNKDKN